MARAGVSLCLLVGIGLWLAELPALEAVPGLALLPRLSEWPVVDRIPPAAQVFGVAAKAAPVRPEKVAVALPASAAPLASRPLPSHDVVVPIVAALEPSPSGVTTAVQAVALPPIVQAAAMPPAVQAAALSPAVQATAIPSAPGAAKVTPVYAKRHSHGGVVHAARRVLGVPLQVVTVDLADPAVVGTLVLANNAKHPNVAGNTVGDEEFAAMVGRTRAAVAINGTFFSKDDEKRVMGNMVRQGARIKYSQWDHDGTTFWLGRDNRPGMITPHGEGVPPWDSAWLALSCGPRLLRNGMPWLQPSTEGFKDPHVLGVAGRSALGFDRAGQRLYLVSFDGAVDLAKEAAVMHDIGCYEAMNLDGGASRSLALGNRLVVQAGRKLTNVLAFYDTQHPAPSALRTAFGEFKPAGE